MRLRLGILFIITSVVLLFGGEEVSARTAKVVIQHDKEILTQIDTFQVLSHQEPGVQLRLDDLTITNQSDVTDFKLFLSFIKDDFHQKYLAGFIVIKSHDEEKQVSLDEVVRGLTIKISSGNQLTLSPHFEWIGDKMSNETQEMTGKHVYQLSIEKAQKMTESEIIKSQGQASERLPLTGEKSMPTIFLIGLLIVLVLITANVKKE